MTRHAAMPWILSAVWLLVALLTATPANAQTTALELQILDGAGLAIAGAAITVSSDGRPTVTGQSDEAGRFQLSGLSPGRYQVTVMREGFATLTETISVGPDASPTTIRLEPAELVEDVTVVASAFRYQATEAQASTRFDAPLLEQPQSVQVVTRGIIEDRQLQRLNDVAYQASGVQPISGYGGVRSTGYIVRGFRQNQAAGSFRNGFREDVFLSSSDPINVERVEFLKGPASVLYGQAEVGGIVNTVTKRPPSVPYAQATMGFGSYGLARPTFDVGGPLGSGGTAAYRLNLAFEDQGSFRDYHHQQSFFIAPRLTWSPTERTSVDVEVEAQRYDYTFDIGFLAEPEFLQVPLGNFYGEDTNSGRVRQAASRVEVTHRLADAWSVRGAVAYMNVHSTPNYVSMFGLQADRRTINRIAWQSVEDSRIYTTRGEVVANLQRGTLTHRIVVGAERTERNYKYDFDGFAVAPIDVFSPVHGAPLGPGLFGFSDDQLWSANAIYGQGLFQLRNNITALLGGRIDLSSASFSDYHTNERLGSRADNDVSPRAGLVFNPTPASAVYGSFSTSFLPQAPTTFSPVSRDPDGFEPEVGRQVEVGYKHELLNGRLTLTGAVFRIIKENVVTPDPDDPMVSIQTGEQRSRGVEIDLAGEFLPGLQVVFNYAYTDAFVSRDNRIPVGNRLVGAPAHAGGALVTYRIDAGSLRGASLGVSMYGASERHPRLPNNAAVMPAYARTDLLLSYERDRWTLRVAVNNLLDGTHYDAHSFFIVPRAPRHVLATIGVRLTR